MLPGHFPNLPAAVDIKGTIVVYAGSSYAWEKIPATVTYLFPPRSNRRAELIVQLDGVDPDKQTFTRNILGRTLYFRLTQKRRWVALGYQLEPGEQPGGIHFLPGIQVYQEPIF